MAKRNEQREFSPPPVSPPPDPLPWIGLGLLALAFLSYPWLAFFTVGRLWLGIPLILWYLFAVMAGLIAVAALLRPEA